MANATLWLVGLYRATHVAEPAAAAMATTHLPCVHLGCARTLHSAALVPAQIFIARRQTEQAATCTPP